MWFYKGDREICFLDGGRGAPQAADTVETLNALGVRSIISVGMTGVFKEGFDVGDIIIPPKAFSEEGTSHHYYENIEYAEPDEILFEKATEYFSECRKETVITTDAIYRQTYHKERLWREKGCVGVDMETSALFSVSKYLGLNTVTILTVSDIHPLNEESSKNLGWKWQMTEQKRKEIIFKCIDFGLSI